MKTAAILLAIVAVVAAQPNWAALKEPKLGCSITELLQCQTEINRELPLSIYFLLSVSKVK